MRGENTGVSLSVVSENKSDECLPNVYCFNICSFDDTTLSRLGYLDLAESYDIAKFVVREQLKGLVQQGT